MMYRIINGLVATEPPPFMHHLGAATRGQQHKYIVPYSRTTLNITKMQNVYKCTEGLVGTVQSVK
jgi:hypothetical protein